MRTDTLHMLRCRLQIPGLIALARRRRLPVRDVDLGYVVHSALGELFGDDAPQPFSLRDQSSRFATVLAYSALAVDELESIARADADPALFEIFDWETFAAKPMPARWPSGARFSFETRICPVVRMAADGPKHRKGAEVDAFLAECWRTGGPDGPVDREQVYRDWLAKRLETGGVRVLQLEMTSFKRERLLRRTHAQQRKAHLCERPSATFTGLLEVADPERLHDMMCRGIGRHRAFGFGMVLMRHAPR